MAVGFLGKLVVFEAGSNAGLLPLLIILVLSSVIAFGYYLRIVLIMWVKKPVERFQLHDRGIAMFACEDVAEARAQADRLLEV